MHHERPLMTGIDRSNSSSLERTLRIKYLIADKRFVDADRMVLEKNLRRLTDVTLSEVKSVDAPDLYPCDLLIVAARNVAAIDFSKWLDGFKKRIKSQGQVQIPALVLTDAAFEDLRDILAESVQENWYFDVIHADHISSLPIRVANLLKIHDHLHEMKRYENALRNLGDRVADLEARVKAKEGIGS